jgi:hypothetical protein
LNGIELRGLLAGITFIAFLLWPLHLWLMQSTYIAVANYESLVANLCLNESRSMAERAEECRRRAAGGAEWDLDDEVSEFLKICPYPSDGPGHSWGEQAEIWDRAAERSHRAAQRHLANSEWYEP